MYKSIMNVSKTKKSFRIRLCIGLFLQNLLLEETESLKYLGVTLDKSFSFNKHIKGMSRKLGKHIATVLILRHFVAREILLSYYMIYMKLVIQYGIPVFEGTSFGKLQNLSCFSNVIPIISMRNYI